MSGFENGSIILDEERNIYYAGQVLSGRIEFGLIQPLVFKAITVQFYGESSVQWDEVEVEEYNGVRRETTVGYEGREQYLNVVQCVCGGVGVSQLAAGSHSIPFRCQIPATAPSYFEGRDGGIAYFVRACLEYPDGRDNIVLEESFEVVVPLDLNVIPEMKQPIFLDFEEVIGSCFCGSGAMTLQVRLPAAGYCPGQPIPIEIDASNQSSVEISKIIFELVRREKYHSLNPPSDQCPPEKSLKIVKCGPIMTRTKRSVSCELVVPDMIAPVLHNCRIITVEFFFKVKIKMSGCHDDLDDEAQIYLGLVPLMELTQGQYRHPMQSDLPKAPVPSLNTPPEFIQHCVYPSVTLENQMQPVHVQNVSNYPGVNSYPPSGNASYPNNAPYPGNVSNAPYPSAKTPYPVANPTHLGTNPSYPGTNPPYPGTNPPHPGTNSPYPGTNPPYPGSNPPYPGSNPPYPGSHPPYPGSHPPYPGQTGTSPNASNTPYPSNTSPFATGNIGFITPRVTNLTSPGYPTGPILAGDNPPPFNPSAPTAP